jgi:hypothetical protein
MIDNLIIDNFYQILQTKFKLTEEMRNHYGKILSPKFNSFDFWWIDENKVSDILSFLLNPEETHSQGRIFLKQFLRFVNINQDCENCSIEVKRELSTNENRRIDIVINFNNGEFVIGIENKIYETTADQYKQIEHYCEYLKSISNDKFCLFYLAPKNKILSEESISKNERELLLEKGQFKKISYEEDIIPCIHQFSMNSESDRVRAFILDFEKTLKQMYMGEKFMDEQSLIVDYATNNLQNLETTLKIGFTIGEIKSILKDKFYKQCEMFAKELNLKYDIREFYDSFRFFPQNWINHSICFYFESGSLKYGICRNSWDKNKTRKNEIEELLGGNWNVSNWFLCENYLYRNFENDTTGWLDIEREVLIEKIREFVKNVTTNEKLISIEL